MNELNPTHIDSTLVSAHDNSDVASYLSDYGDIGWYGVTECISWSGDICKHWHERFNTHYGPYTASQKKSLACHEFGHTTGLNHYTNHQTDPSCMENPDWHTHYNDHDKSHINGYYP